jgi:aerobic carbon-monoxide dehydrogenase medium subunit
MKPPRFDYYDPRSVDEAVKLLAGHGMESKVLAGGQSLMPLLNMRLVRPKVIVDINRITNLNYVKPWDGGLSIGATVHLRALHDNGLIAERLPILRDASLYIGHPQIRSRGTVCGSLAHADPAAELPALAVALQAQLVATGSKGARTISSDAFYTSYFTTSLEPDEILTEVRFPGSPKEMGWTILEVSRRHGDFALVGIVAGLAANRDSKTISEARLVCFGVGPTPVRLKDAEQALVGQTAGDPAFQKAAELARQGVDPDNDVHATADYRRSVAGALTRRALGQVWKKLGGT